VHSEEGRYYKAMIDDFHQARATATTQAIHRKALALEDQEHKKSLTPLKWPNNS
jgi:hypothetical protein